MHFLHLDTRSRSEHLTCQVGIPKRNAAHCSPKALLCRFTDSIQVMSSVFTEDDGPSHIWV